MLHDLLAVAAFFEHALHTWELTGYPAQVLASFIGHLVRKPYKKKISSSYRHKVPMSPVGKVVAGVRP